MTGTVVVAALVVGTVSFVVEGATVLRSVGRLEVVAALSEGPAPRESPPLESLEQLDSTTATMIDEAEILAKER